MERFNRDKVAMPTKELNIYWLDDDSTRFDDFKSLIEDSATDFSLSVKVHTTTITPDILNIIAQWEAETPVPAPDLFMLDHIILHNLPHKMDGNTLAHILRKTFAKIPLVSVTAMFTPGHDHSGQDVHEYTAIIDYTKLSENFEDLFSIAKDYRQLESVSWQKLVDILFVPESEQRVLQLALPQDLVSEFTPTKHNQLARWLRSELLGKPGFLFDELHAATMLGLSEQGFRKVKDKFDVALYKGPFATMRRPLWWQTKLREHLYEIVGKESSDYTQSAGRALAEFNADDLCKCYVSNTSDAVDFVVAQAYPNKSRHVVRDVFSAPHPEIASMLPGFDQPLVIDGR